MPNILEKRYPFKFIRFGFSDFYCDFAFLLKTIVVYVYLYGTKNPFHYDIFAVNNHICCVVCSCVVTSGVLSNEPIANAGVVSECFSVRVRCAVLFTRFWRCDARWSERGEKGSVLFFCEVQSSVCSYIFFSSFAFEIAAPPVAPILFRTANVINQWLNYEWKRVDWFTGKFTLKFSLICSLLCRFCLVEFLIQFFNFYPFFIRFFNFHAYCFNFFLISHFFMHLWSLFENFPENVRWRVWSNRSDFRWPTARS